MEKEKATTVFWTPDGRLPYLKRLLILLGVALAGGFALTEALGDSVTKNQDISIFLVLFGGVGLLWLPLAYFRLKDMGVSDTFVIVGILILSLILSKPFPPTLAALHLALLLIPTGAFSGRADRGPRPPWLLLVPTVARSRAPRWALKAMARGRRVLAAAEEPDALAALKSELADIDRLLAEGTISDDERQRMRQSALSRFGAGGSGRSA
jgi:hypothetical protein